MPTPPLTPARATYNVVVIGGGIAGAAVFHHLTRTKRAARVLLLEREELPGTHATGRNAAMVRQNVDDPVERELAVRTRHFFERPEFPLEFRQCGSLILRTEPRSQGVLPTDDRLELRELTPSAACTHVPILNPSTFARATYCPTDGVVDVAGLLHGYLRSAAKHGAEVRLGCEVTGLATREDGTFLLTTNRGPFATETGR